MSTATPFDIPPRQGLIERVVGMLRSHITQGNWQVGSRIPTEPELSKLTGVGRNTIREAVQSLVHAGLLERRQGSGTYVLADNEVAVAMSRFSAGTNVAPAASLEAFGALWVGACRLAASRRTAGQAEDLGEATIDLIGDPAILVTSETDLGFVGSNVRLHPVIEVILEAAASPYMADMATGILQGLLEHGTVTCRGELLLGCATAVCAGSSDGAANAASRVVAHLRQLAQEELQ